MLEVDPVAALGALDLGGMVQSGVSSRPRETARPKRVGSGSPTRSAPPCSALGTALCSRLTGATAPIARYAWIGIVERWSHDVAPCRMPVARPARGACYGALPRGLPRRGLATPRAGSPRVFPLEDRGRSLSALAPDDHPPARLVTARPPSCCSTRAPPAIDRMPGSTPRAPAGSGHSARPSACRLQGAVALTSASSSSPHGLFRRLRLPAPRAHPAALSPPGTARWTNGLLADFLLWQVLDAIPGTQGTGDNPSGRRP